MDNSTVFSVFEVTRHIRQVIESSIEPIYVRGEISNFVHHSSGHMYFNLKDDNATIKCTFFKNTNYKLDFKPKDGMEVTCFGRITVYEKGGTYNLNVTNMTQAGIGVMQQKFEELKKKLHSEGLFETSIKKPLPKYPERIGIVTSPTGAALQDIRNILTRRFPVLTIVYPSLVQGSNAPSDLIRGIEYFNSIENVEVVIITRGGGSQEDLFCFNDEQLARAIFNSKIPVISAVGHEIDFTICDFVADFRAPTPSAAAEIVVPNKEDLIGYLESVRRRMNLTCENKLNGHKNTISNTKYELNKYHPERVFQNYQQRFDLASIAMINAQHIIKESVIKLETMRVNLDNSKTNMILNRMKQKRLHLINVNQSLEYRSSSLLDSARKKVDSLSNVLSQLSPQKIMDKGWTITEKDGVFVRSVSQLSKGDNVQIRFVDGCADVEVTGLES